MTLVEELLNLRERLQEFLEGSVERRESAEIPKLEEAANTVGKAWSGSWLGYQACVYYTNLAEPPAGAQFSSEWGFRKVLKNRSTTGAWQEFTFTGIQNAILRLAGISDLRELDGLAARASGLFVNSQSELVSILQIDLANLKDSNVERLLEEASALKILNQADIEGSWIPSGAVMSRDSLAITQGIKIPPHMSILAQAEALRSPLEMCFRLLKMTTQVISHLERRARAQARAERVGTNVFIGHGRSPLWRDLKDYVRDRLKLPHDEFNRVPVAGITNISRLSQMLDAAAVAFLVMTAEDEQADGQLIARLNVVHEAGLFQGRLGFGKAIILLEESCAEFSNIQGLGQIRFPKGQIKASFDEVRQVLEREGLLPE
jgi:hypothetical protein